MTVLILLNFHNKIYAFKGGNTGEFWLYNPERDSWIGLDTIPKDALDKKRVKGGGALAAGEGKIYALKGNNTLSIWQYNLGTTSFSADLSLKIEKIGGNSAVIKKQENLFLYATPTKGISITFNRCPMTTNLSLYNVLGNLIFKMRTDKRILIIKGLPPGIYLLQLEGKNYKERRKIIVAK